MSGRMRAVTRASAGILLTCAAGCQVPPRVEFEAQNADGSPRAGATVTFVPSDRITLYLPQDQSAPRSPGRVVAEWTDEHGRCAVFYNRPSQPWFLWRLLGADSIPTQWIRARLENPDGTTSFVTVFIEID